MVMSQVRYMGTVTDDAFCNTSKTAKMEKMDSGGATTWVSSDRKDKLIMAIDNEMAGHNTNKKKYNDGLSSHKVANAKRNAEQHAARRSHPPQP
jgi:hypothetical protein